jgi:hypothetical protein
VQDALHPMNEDRGFSAEIRLKEAHPEDEPIIRKVLNAGAAFGVVQRVGNSTAHFYIHRDLVRTLSNIQARLMMSGAYDQPRVAAPQAHARVRDAGRMQDYRAPLASGEMPAQLAPPTLSRAQSEDEVRQQFADNLLDAIGLRPEDYAAMAGPVAGAAISAAHAFAQVRQRNAVLDKHLAGRDDEARKAFFDAYSSVQGRIADHDERRIELLNQAYDELQSKWQILMLMPDGPYESLIESLLAELEKPAGDGRLKPSETSLHRLLVNLKGQLGASNRNSVEEWRRLENVFKVDVAVDANSNLIMLEKKTQAGQR